MISTPYVPVPPPRYGGTELIVAELCAGLAAAGHEVVLFATSDSNPAPGVTLRARQPAVWPPAPYVELDHAAWAIEQILADERRFDVVHAHLPAALAFTAMLDTRLVYTVHHDDGAEHASLQSLYCRSRAQFITISARQRQLWPAIRDARVIHHGLDPERHPLGRGDGGYCAFLGRLAPEKGAHVALDVALAADCELRIGGQPHWRDHDYFAREIEPRLERRARVYHLGEIGGVAKQRLLGDARALLFPIDWEEPFGLVMIEAMLSGTPVLAFARGAAPEVVEDGVTGWLCRDADDMARRLRALDGFDRQACRERALARWTTGRMVRDHLSVYEQLQTWVGDAAAAETVA